MTERPLADADRHGPRPAAARLRFAEFGALPERVRPGDYVALIETKARRDRPEPAGSREQSLATHDGAG